MTGTVPALTPVWPSQRESRTRGVWEWGGVVHLSQGSKPLATRDHLPWCPWSLAQLDQGPGPLCTTVQLQGCGSMLSGQKAKGRQEERSRAWRSTADFNPPQFLQVQGLPHHL